MGSTQESQESLVKYLVIVESRKGLRPPYKTGFVIQDNKIESAKQKALAKVPKNGKFRFRKPHDWVVTQIQLLGGVDEPTTDS